ncbi:MAG TPA: hypothetical protein VIF09_08585 [Polyangiaceae bacterium]
MPGPAPTPAQSAPSATETVVHPDPGLASGRWEAPSWVFWAAFAAALLGGITWLLLALRARRAPR